MEKKTTHRIIGVLVVIGLVVILMPLLFGGNNSEPTQTASVKAPPFPDDSQSKTTLAANDAPVTPVANPDPATQNNPAPIAQADNNAPTAQDPTATSTMPSPEQLQQALAQNPSAGPADSNSNSANSLDVPMVADANNTASNPVQATDNKSDNAKVNPAPNASQADANKVQPTLAAQGITPTAPAQPSVNARPVNPPSATMNPATQASNPAAGQRPISSPAPQTPQAMQPQQTPAAMQQHMPNPNAQTQPSTMQQNAPMQQTQPQPQSSKEPVSSKPDVATLMNHEENHPAAKKPKTSHHAAKNKTHESLAQFKKTGWVVQMGSFKVRDNAERLANSLRSHGFKAFTHQVNSSMRVYVGPEFKQAEASTLADKIQQQMSLHGIVVTYKPLEL